MLDCHTVSYSVVRMPAVGCDPQRKKMVVKAMNMCNVAKLQRYFTTAKLNRRRRSPQALIGFLLPLTVRVVNSTSQ